MKNTHTWNIWEVIAIQYLQKKWYKIITTNYKFWRVWEIDIITQINEITVFIEVKYRSTNNFGIPEEAINKKKLQKLKKTIEYYCIKNSTNFEYIQFDVIVIQKKKTSNRITQYKNVEI